MPLFKTNVYLHKDIVFFLKYFEFFTVTEMLYTCTVVIPYSPCISYDSIIIITHWYLATVFTKWFTQSYHMPLVILMIVEGWLLCLFFMQRFLSMLLWNCFICCYRSIDTPTKDGIFNKLKSGLICIWYGLSNVLQMILQTNITYRL